MHKFDLDPPENDGLFIPPDVDPWSADKHYFLRRYMHAFTVAMKTKPWDSLHYIDLFSGAGIERIKGKGLDWGSPLIAAQLPVPFDQLHLVDKTQARIDALTQRLHLLSPRPANPQLICGDANKRVSEVVDEIPCGALSLAFLDPYGLHLHYDTLAVLAQRRVDFVLLFPDHMDALRNWRVYYKGNPKSKLTQVLGTDEWESALNEAPSRHHAEILRKIYVKQIGKLGYQHFDYERIERPNGRHLYRSSSAVDTRREGRFGPTSHRPSGADKELLVSRLRAFATERGVQHSSGYSAR